MVLETEFDNEAALALYASLGFIREKRLHRFYMNGKDAFRLVLVIDPDDAEGASELETAVKATRVLLDADETHGEGAISRRLKVGESTHMV